MLPCMPMHQNTLKDVIESDKTQRFMLGSKRPQDLFNMILGPVIRVKVCQSIFLVNGYCTVSINEGI